MYKGKPKNFNKTTLRVNNAYEGETIEQKIFRITNNKEPITDGAPLIYTDRSEGVQPDYNIRTDRFEVAIDAMDKVTKAQQAKREERAKAKEEAKVVKLGGNEGENGGKNEAGG